jgi:hypothetical protein
VVAALFLLAVAIYELQDFSRVRLWVQVFAGNWSPFPERYSPFPGELPLSMFIGVLLNLAALTGIINILWRQIITQKKERVMILAEALRTRDRTIKNRVTQAILEAFQKNQRPDVAKIVDDAFI